MPGHGRRRTTTEIARALLGAACGAAVGAKRVCIIGSGAAGLAAARRLSEAGLQPTVLERGDALGGLWALGEAAPGGAVYKGLVTNLPKELMAFHDMPFSPKVTRSFVRACDVANYLQSFAREHKLERFVRLRCTVVDVQPCVPLDTSSRLGVDRWRVRWRDDSAASTASAGNEAVEICEEFDAVIVANGHYEQPASPPLPGLDAFVRAGGQVCHARYYKAPHQYSGKDVVIVGARASGTDIAREVATVARSVVVADPACAELEGGAVLWRAPALQGLGAGPSGPHAVFAPRPAAAAAARARHEAGDGGEPPSAPPEDAAPRELPCDAVILCTGYAYSFPFLGEDAMAHVGGLRAGRGLVAPLHLRLFHAAAPSLSFIGLPHSVVPFPLMDAQATLVARVLAADERAAVALPPAEARPALAASLVAEADARTQPDPLYLGDAQWDYIRTLARFGGFWEPALDLRLRLSEVIYKDVQACRPTKPGADDWYRKREYRLLPSADAPEYARVSSPSDGHFVDLQPVSIAPAENGASGEGVC